jgi:DNA (cytosine-5)-methyltransferase 1
MYNHTTTGNVAATLNASSCVIGGRSGPSVLCFEPRSPDGVPRIVKGDVCPTLNTAQGGQRQPAALKSSVRRLTPLECERLQGFPDGWTNIGEWIDSKGKKHDSSDSARYKALGNSIALPFWRFLCKRISAQYARRATMASLFDGIGGFPLVWEEWNGKGSAVWASEIEEFPIAVTKYHFKE